MIPDWQLPTGVDRGLWDYLCSEEMVAAYDEQISDSPLAIRDILFCADTFGQPGKLIDLGCGTGRLCRVFTEGGYRCVGVDLSDEMLVQARKNAPFSTFVKSNLVDLAEISDASFDYAACLFSTLGMIRGEEHRQSMLKNVHRILKPGGTFVVHVHNRGFHGLGWKRFRTADLTMPQAYGGAPLTLHHFTKAEIAQLLEEMNFNIRTVEPVSTRKDGRFRWPWLWPSLRAYGYLIAAKCKM